MVVVVKKERGATVVDVVVDDVDVVVVAAVSINGGVKLLCGAMDTSATTASMTGV